MRKRITGFCLLILFFLLLVFPEEVKSGSLDGLFLWYNSVVPILLPFLILSNLIVGTDSISVFLSPLAVFRTHTRQHNIYPVLVYPVFLGLFCGFPMGAKTIADLIHSNKITVNQGNLLLPFVNQASPMFLAGFVGIHILKKELSFSEMLFYLYIPVLVFFLVRYIVTSFLPSMILRISANIHNTKTSKKSFEHRKIFKTTKQLESCYSFLPSNSQKQKNSMSLNLEHTIWNSFYIVVIIGIYMMLFSIASRLCVRLLPENRPLSVLLCSLEFSTGLNRLQGLTYLNPVMRTGLTLALTSFGGFCTAAQTSALVKDTGISMKSYLIWKSLIAIGVFILYYYSSSSASS